MKSHSSQLHHVDEAEKNQLHQHEADSCLMKLRRTPSHMLSLDNIWLGVVEILLNMFLVVLLCGLGGVHELALDF